MPSHRMALRVGSALLFASAHFGMEDVPAADSVSPATTVAATSVPRATEFRMISETARRNTRRAARGRWHHNFDEALREARDHQRAVVLHFYADWCPPCRKMESDVLGIDEVAVKFREDVVGVKLNRDHHVDLALRYGVQKLPTDVVIDPQGRVLAVSVGPMDRGAYLAKLASWSQLAKADRPAAESAELIDPQSGARIERHVVQRPVVPESQPPANRELQRPDAGSAKELGLRGFSPVSLADRQQWVPGSPEVTAEFQGTIYRFQNDEERAEFRRHPERYVVQHDGVDLVELSRGGQRATGSLSHGAVFNRRIYIFATAENRAAFLRSPHDFVRSAER